MSDETAGFIPPIWCAGMYASGSTWVYNVVLALAAAGRPDLPVSGRFVGGWDEMAGHDAPGATHVVKSHEADAPSRAALLASVRHIVVSIRDPRDALTSLMLYQRHSFELAMRRLAPSVSVCGALAADPRAMLLRYEDGFAEDPATVRRIAAKLGVPLDDDAAMTIFENHQRSAVEQFVAALDDQKRLHEYPGGAYDPRSNWHKHHAGRSGEVGRWRRMLTPDQIRATETAFGAWMDNFGYSLASGGKLRSKESGGGTTLAICAILRD